jgi:type IV pilus assembly protein PilW
MIKYKNNGYSFIELLVALTIGVILIGTMLTLFIDNKTTSITQNNVSKMQDDSRLALSVIENDVENSGYRGCISGNLNGLSGTNFYNVTINNPKWTGNTNFIEAYQGTGASFSPALPTYLSGLSPAPNPNMDILIVRGANETPTVLSADMGSGAGQMQVYSTNGLTNGDVAIITNCYSQTLFDVASGTNGTAVVEVQPLPLAYQTGSFILKYDTKIFYVGTDNVLYKVYNTNAPVPLAYNVEKFAVLYGVNNNSITSPPNVSQYLNASALPGFSNIVATRIGLVIKTNDIFTTVSKGDGYSYTFNGTTVTPTDGKLRKVYFTTVTLRNMMQ